MAARKTSAKRATERKRQKTLKASPAYRAKVVQAVATGEGISAVSERFGISQGTVRNWVEKSVEGVRKKLDEVRAKAPAQLPIEPARSRPRKALPLVPTGHVCPHCGGPIEAE